VAEKNLALARLFDARARGDTAYLVESLRLEPENASLAAKWLADEGVADAIPALIRLFDAADPSARIAAIKALDELGLPDSVRTRLVEIVKTDENDGVRMWAASALGSYGDPELTPLLVSLLADPSWQVSVEAAGALGRQGDPSALVPLRLARRSLRRSPVRFYLHRRVYSAAIKALSHLES
jgi:HEAT repeat protein